MNHRPIVVVASMSGSICLRNPLHLDGILLAARERRFGEGLRGTPLDAVAVRDGVYQTSVGFLISEGVAGVTEGASARVRKLDMRGRDGQNIHFDPGSRAKERTIDGMSPYRNTLVSEITYGNVRSVVWQALADPDMVLDLLQEISTIGKQHSTGWGKVDAFEAYDCDAEPATCGLASDGHALRNLPLPLAEALGVDCRATFPGRVEPPYALSEGITQITGPGLTDTLVTNSEAKALLRYAAEPALAIAS